ncbi:MAG: ferritin family protein [bacterium]|nr:ferritin family protein [bacterium]
MKQWNSFEDILTFAINSEENAAAFYRDLAAKSDNADMAAALEEFAVEEDGHKAILESIRESNMAVPSDEEIVDLKIVDYLVEVDPTEDLNYRKVLILAMKREKAAFALYTRLAGKADDPKLRKLLQALAQEEAKHKLRFEIEYDDYILSEN